MFNNTVSPSRTYVAFCLNPGGDYTLKRFHLPGTVVVNDAHNALGYFLRCLDRVSTIHAIVAYDQLVEGNIADV